jgi:3'-phosphoadenosine 5'-phosphosulfate sulfotransferase (PAPS reductase)/FAD synthetase
MNELLQQSHEIAKEAIASYSPYAIVLAISGGNDSIATYYVAKRLGIQIDFILHINTRTGIRQTTEFVRKFAESEQVVYIEGNAGTAYENYVMRKGFFGRGKTAHTYSYHILKKDCLRKTLSANIRQGQRGRNILILNGARIEESDNRAKNFANKVIRQDTQKSNIWVNLVHYWKKIDRDEFLTECKAVCNPVAKELCRSGECMCGTMQSQQAREEAAFFFPEWGEWLDKLERRVMQRFPWKWGQDIPKTWQLEQKGQLRLFDADFQPMCSDCVRQVEANAEDVA